MLIQSYSSHSSTLHKQMLILVSFSPLHLASVVLLISVLSLAQVKYFYSPSLYHDY